MPSRRHNRGGVRDEVEGIESQPSRATHQRGDDVKSIDEGGSARGQRVQESNYAHAVPRYVKNPPQSPSQESEPAQREYLDNYESQSSQHQPKAHKTYVPPYARASSEDVVEESSSLSVPPASPWTGIPSALVQFCRIKLHDFDGCAKFARENPDLWSDYEKLPSVARIFLLSKKPVLAQMIVSRYLMLERSLNDASDASLDLHELRSQQLQELASGKNAQANFMKRCAAIYNSLNANLVSATQSVETVEQSDDLQGAYRVPTVRSDLSRRISVTSKESLGPSVGESVEENVSVSLLDTIPEDLDSLQDHQIYTGKDINTVFGPGCVISIFWHENYGINNITGGAQQQPNLGKQGTGFVTKTTGLRDEYIYSHTRRFVIIAQRRGHSIGLPINSYNKRGATKNFADAEKYAHAIVYSTGEKPLQFAGEPQFTKKPVEVRMENEKETLSPTSRLCFSRPTSVPHNAKVKFVGRVVERQRRHLFATFVAELIESTIP